MIIPISRRDSDDATAHCKPVASWLRMCISDIILTVCMLCFMVYVVWGISWTIRLYKTTRERHADNEKSMFCVPSCLYRKNTDRTTEKSKDGTQFTSLPASMGGRTMRRRSASSENPQPVSPREHLPRSPIDTYHTSPSMDDSLLYAVSDSYLRPTPFPAPIVMSHDRHSTPVSPISPFTASPESPRRFQLANVPPHRAKGPRALKMQHTPQTPSPLSSLSTARPTSPTSLQSGPPSPISFASTPSIYSTPSAGPCPSPPPLPLPPMPLSPTPSSHGSRVRPKMRKILVPEDFKDMEKLKNGNMRMLLSPTPPPPAYTQHEIGLLEGRKDAGFGRHWGWGIGGSRSSRMGN